MSEPRQRVVPTPGPRRAGSAAPFEACFIDAGGRAPGGRRFCVYHPPAGGIARGAVLYLQPFAEEMNKSRRMAALQSRALAAQGHAVLQIDLFGCGDSSGDFGDASWQAWLDDAVHAATWLSAKTGAPLRLWGLRSGCLLAAAAASRIDQPCDFLFWQPVLSGATLLQQFLRLKLAGDMLGGGDRETTAGLRARLRGGEPVEVAGYVLSPALAAGLEQASLLAPARPCRVDWIEVVSAATAIDAANAALSPAQATAAAQWSRAGHEVLGRVAAGPSFWQSSEIEEAPRLLAATCAALLEPALA